MSNVSKFSEINLSFQLNIFSSNFARKMDVEAATTDADMVPDGATNKMAALQVIRYSLASLLSHRQAAPAQRPPSFANARLSCILVPPPARSAHAPKTDGAESPLSCSSSGSSGTQNSRRGKNGERKKKSTFCKKRFFFFKNSKKIKKKKFPKII